MTLDLQIKFNCASEYVYMFLEFGAYIQWAHESEWLDIGMKFFFKSDSTMCILVCSTCYMFHSEQNNVLYVL